MNMKTWQEALSKIEVGQHAVHYYTDDFFLGQMIGFYVAEGLAKNENIVLICSDSHATLFEKVIHELGHDISQLKEQGNLFILNEEAILSLFMLDGFPNKEIFERVIGDVLAKAGANGNPVRAYGEMVNHLWHQGQREAAIRLEDQWNSLLENNGRFFLLCAYSLDNLAAEVYDNDFHQVCHTHDIIVPGPDPKKFQQTVDRNLRNTLGTTLSSMVMTFAHLEDDRDSVLSSQKYLLWLSKHMPLTVKKILAVANF